MLPGGLAHLGYDISVYLVLFRTKVRKQVRERVKPTQRHSCSRALLCPLCAELEFTRLSTDLVHCVICLVQFFHIHFLPSMLWHYTNTFRYCTELQLLQLYSTLSLERRWSNTWKRLGCTTDAPCHRGQEVWFSAVREIRRGLISGHDHIAVAQVI